MSFSEFVDNSFYRPAMTGVLSAVGSRYILGQQDMKRNAMFGATVAGAFLLTDVIANYALPKSELKSFEQAVVELAGASAGTLVLERIFEPRVTQDNAMQQVGVIIASDIVATYARDIMTNRL